MYLQYASEITYKLLNKKMSNLLDLTINGYGGIDNWKKNKSVTVRIQSEGLTWIKKQQPGLFENIYVTADLTKQHVSFHPVNGEDWHSTFTPERIAIENKEGDILEELLNPRQSFANHTRETPWSKLQAFYFASYAMWTYLNAPFCFLDPGYEVKEIEPWEEGGEKFRRLQITFPKEIATHCPVQVFYIDETGLIKRHSYSVAISPGAKGAHYSSDFIEMQGIKIPTRRVVYVEQENNLPLKPEPVLISIAINEINFK